MIVLQAFGESLSEGEMKLPAALFTTMWGRPPHCSTQASAAALMAAGSRTSAHTGKTYRNNNDNVISGLYSLN